MKSQITPFAPTRWASLIAACLTASTVGPFAYSGVSAAVAACHTRCATTPGPPRGSAVPPPLGVTVQPVSPHGPRPTYIVSRRGWTTIVVRCTTACVGDLTLTARAPDAATGQTRVQAITPTRHFMIRSAHTTRHVRLHLNLAGLAGLRAGHGRLAAVAVMRYAAAPGRRGETDRSRMTLKQPSIAVN
jgi:hypothetical protein